MPKIKKTSKENAMAVGQVQGGFQLKGRIWIERNQQTYLSWGRIILLERIKEHGSVSAAAKSMRMSFSHAWRLVEDMNTLAPEPLVEKQTGGARGGGAWLTNAGERALIDFYRISEHFQRWIEQESL